MKGLAALVLAGMIALVACGGSSSKSASTGALAGNWQFTLQRTTAPRTVTLLSGFLQQTQKTVTGAVEFTPPVAPSACGGAFQVTGSNDGQNVTLSVNEGGATVSLLGTASASTMGGTYSLVANGCGKNESGTWTATLVKPLNGTFQGVLHSKDNTGSPSLNGSDFAVIGQISQGENIGATQATLTGTMNVPNADYPCFTDATLSGTVTGTQVLMNIIATNGTVIGTIGSTANTVLAVTAKPDGSGFLNLQGTGYAVRNAPGCSSSEVGNVCVDIGTATSCKQQLAFSQEIVAFNPILVSTSSPSQTVKLTNQSSSAIDISSLKVVDPTGQNEDKDYSVDFSACPTSSGATLAAGASCPVVITFTPTASCPPLLAGVPPSTPLACPLPRAAALTINLGVSDPDSPHVLQLTGIGLDSVVPDVKAVDFGLIPSRTVSPAQTITFSNQGPKPVTILNVETGWQDTQLATAPFTQCGTPGTGFPLQVCDFVTKSQITPANNCTPPPTLQDSCTGQPIPPGGSCKVDFVYCPLNPTSPPVPPNTFGIREGIQIVTDERDSNGVPTADSTRVPVQLTGTAN